MESPPSSWKRVSMLKVQVCSKHQLPLRAKGTVIDDKKEEIYPKTKQERGDPQEGVLIDSALCRHYFFYFCCEAKAPTMTL
jgi:hypothetical protein